MGKNTPPAKRLSLMRSQARLWLGAFLAAGTRSAREVRDGWLREGLSGSTVMLAAKDLRITKEIVGGRWQWRFPTAEESLAAGEREYRKRARAKAAQPSAEE